jgi:predicted GIY-YIG superfamily endonuclease
MWQVYILYSAQLNRFYSGITGDMAARLESHLQHAYGEQKFTSKATDWKLFLYW